ncbi:MAG: 50S ribosomal protein L9 [Alphaproteobacteria bacterium]
MDLLLLERIENLGNMGDVVKVRPGYARNYLLPQKKALRATKENRDYFESRRVELETANVAKRSVAETLSKDVNGVSVIIVRQASESGQLYGSVRPKDIADALAEKGAGVDRTQVRLNDPIKTIGMHRVRVALHPEVVVEITANVARSPEEAELQAQGKSLVTESREAERAADEETRAAIAEAAAEMEAEETRDQPE